MTFSPELAEIRFGCGLSPTLPAAETPQAMLDGLSGPDEMALRFAIDPYSVFRLRIVELMQARKQLRKARGTSQEGEFQKRVKKVNKAARADMIRWHGQTLLRWAQTRQGFRERLAMFWADHFTAVGKIGGYKQAGSPYVEEAIRPNMTGYFADLLIAAETHPLMLHYLDQNRSVGPGSRFARKAKRERGLNENLAREVMELHTLGVDGPYTQDDVRQLAKLFTGLTIDRDAEFAFMPKLAEPGAETVLDHRYGGDPATLDSVHQALRDLATHPATARHIARKLAVHFVADQPDPALIDHVAERYRITGGHLLSVYSALLEHPAAWEMPLQNVKPPMDFVASACRALAVQPDRIAAMPANRLAGQMLRPMALMGQPWQKPNGPDGWPEEDDAWITPQGLSARLRWAMSAPRNLRPDLPDPRDFVAQALGEFAPKSVTFAASAAETRSEAIGLVLSSPAFQRR